MPNLVKNQPGRPPTRTAEQIINSAERFGPPFRLRIEFRVWAPHNATTKLRSYARLPGVGYQITFTQVDQLWRFFTKLHAVVLDIISAMTKQEKWKR